MIHKQSKSRVLLLTIIITSLILPILPVEAKKCPIPSTITVEKINGRITKFEETIPLDIPGMGLPEDAYYRVSVYAVKVRRGVVLIDCGDEALASDLYQAVSATFRRPIKAVYLTHYHADHAGGGEYFQSMGIPVYAPQAEGFFIQLGAQLGGVPDAFTYTGYTPDGYYENIDLYSEFDVIPAPGHTSGNVHIEYCKGRRSYLFTADTILPMMEDDDPSPLDFTFELNFQTAVQNYEAEVAEFGTFWTDQQATLTTMIPEIESYRLVLTGHAGVLGSDNSLGFVIYTLGTLAAIPTVP